MKYNLKPIGCPLCGLQELEKLIPSRKIDEERGYWQEHRDIWISLCLNCGMVFENPQVTVLESRDYNEQHYYNNWFNQVAAHDKLQNTYAPFRWDVLAKKIDWRNVKRAIDVGATGAWSAILKEQNPHVESLLIEPSKAAIDFCRKRYPGVIPVHGILEEFSETEKPLDVITLFYSLYHITNPVQVLKASRQLLSATGRIVVCISHVHLEIDVWGSNQKTPWVDMAHFVRGAPLSYFSRRTLAKTMRLAGLKVVDEFVAEHTRDGEWKGRQDYYVIAEKGESIDAESAGDSNEVRWARDFVRNYSVKASMNSVRCFLEINHTKNLVLVCDDDAYRKWVLSLFDAQGVSVSACSGNELRNRQSSKMLVQQDYILLNATWKPLPVDQKILREKGGRVIDCVQGTHVPGDYDLWTKGSTDEVLITKAFLPVRDESARIFPFSENRDLIRM